VKSVVIKNSLIYFNKKRNIEDYFKQKCLDGHRRIQLIVQNSQAEV
jgi:hypothetical protein